MRNEGRLMSENRNDGEILDDLTREIMCGFLGEKRATEVLRQKNARGAVDNYRRAAQRVLAAGWVQVDALPALLDALDHAEKRADTQTKVAAAFKQALADEYRPYVEQNKAHSVALAAQEEEIAELRARAETAEAALDRVRALCQSADGEWLDADFNGNTVGDIREREQS